MFIYPTSTIRLLRDIPLDITYEHTIYFDSKSDQENYFLSKIKPNVTKPSGKVVSFFLTGQTYTRVGKNIRVSICADDLYDCNYLMFKNTNYGNKWFYAFIKSVNYVNNEVSEIEYEIDVMQTWFFDYELEMCFVEREHSATDNMFEHILEENLDIGKELRCVRKYDDFLFNNLTLIVLYAGLNTSGLAGRPNLLPSGYYLPCYYNFEPSTSQGAIDMTDFIITSGHIQDANDVIAVYQAPAVYDDATETITDPTTYLNIVPSSTETFDGYLPKNKKLYNSPYNIIIVSNNNGGSAIFKFEDSSYSDHKISLCRETNSIPLPVSIVYPTNYRNIAQDWDSGLIFDNFPTCGWVTDTYKAWWAQNKNTFHAKQLSTLVNSGVKSATGLNNSSNVGDIAMSALGNFSNVALNVASDLAKLADIEAMPNQSAGQFKSDVLNLKMHRLGYTVYHMQIKKEFAIIIDAFFTKYGYICKQVKKPNRKARRYWTFTKTLGCIIKPKISGGNLDNTGGMPCDDEAKICSIYDNGITFWKYTYGVDLDVGNYSYTINNDPTGVIGG